MAVRIRTSCNANMNAVVDRVLINRIDDLHWLFSTSISGERATDSQNDLLRVSKTTVLRNKTDLLSSCALAGSPTQRRSQALQRHNSHDTGIFRCSIMQLTSNARVVQARIAMLNPIRSTGIRKTSARLAISQVVVSLQLNSDRCSLTYAGSSTDRSCRFTGK